MLLCWPGGSEAGWSSGICGSCLFFFQTRLAYVGPGVQMWLACLVTLASVLVLGVVFGLSDAGVWPVSSFAVDVASRVLSLDELLRPSEIVSSVRLMSCCYCFVA